MFNQGGGSSNRTVRADGLDPDRTVQYIDVGFNGLVLCGGMNEIEPGKVVIAKGEQFVRLVVAVECGRALCKRMGREEQTWFALSDLTVERPTGPMRFHF